MSGAAVGVVVLVVLLAAVGVAFLNGSAPKVFRLCACFPCVIPTDPFGRHQGVYILLRAVDPHSFFADPDPAVFLNADPDPAA